MLKIVFIILVFVFSNLSSMQPFQFFRQEPSQIAGSEYSKRLKVPHIILVSKEGESFIAPFKIAQKSPVFKDLLSNFEEKESKTIPLREIDRNTLDTIIEIMWSAYDHDKLKGKALLEAIGKDIVIPENQIIPVLLACNFLDFTLGISLITQQISNNRILRDQIIKLIKSHQLSDNTAHQIAKTYFLITRRSFSDIQENRFSYSVRDYLDYRPGRIIIIDNQLDTSDLALNDLDGLFDIPNIQNIKKLNLRNNKLTQLPDTLFTSFNRLEDLDLSNNQLKRLPENIFDNLSNLQSLQLQSNQLRELPVNIFSKLGNLKTLSLAANQLSQLPANIFSNLIHLEDLHIGDNQLIQLPRDIFINLSNLKSLTLFGNQLTQLPATLFTHLPRLETLYLHRNKLTDANKKSIKEAMPVRVEIFF